MRRSAEPAVSVGLPTASAAQEKAQITAALLRCLDISVKPTQRRRSSFIHAKLDCFSALSFWHKTFLFEVTVCNHTHLWSLCCERSHRLVLPRH